MAPTSMLNLCENLASFLLRRELLYATFSTSLYRYYISATLLTSGEKSTSSVLNFLHFFSACNNRPITYTSILSYLTALLRSSP